MATEFLRIRKEFFSKNQLWEDPDFPAEDLTLFYHQKPDLKFEWKRPNVRKF